ncbi:MAG: aldo/keto reductase [Chloroflexi bacterium]|nr:aldo/keto reductase [Chloroflexota bacterium]
MPDLPKRPLGRTGLEVTVLGYGAMDLRGEPDSGPCTDAQADRILNAVLDAGINFVDTARSYGISEERVGKAISHRRSEYYLATKVGGPHTAEDLVAKVQESLKLLRTDYIDLIQLHSNPSRQELEEHGVLDTMRELQHQGKVRFIGISSTNPNMKGQIEMGVFDEFQVPYSILRRDHEELIAAAAATGAGIVLRGGAADGGPGKEEGPYWKAWSDARLDDLLGGMSRQEFILRFTISNPALSTTNVGTINPSHLEENINSVLKGPLPPDIYAEAKRRTAEMEAVGSVGRLRRQNATGQ